MSQHKIVVTANRHASIAPPKRSSLNWLSSLVAKNLSIMSSNIIVDDMLDVWTRRWAPGTGHRAM
jgi:hypothetical protein